MPKFEQSSCIGPKRQVTKVTKKFSNCQNGPKSFFYSKSLSNQDGVFKGWPFYQELGHSSQDVIFAEDEERRRAGTVLIVARIGTARHAWACRAALIAAIGRDHRKLPGHHGCGLRNHQPESKKKYGDLAQ